jgi:hypothetical protein
MPGEILEGCVASPTPTFGGAYVDVRGRYEGLGKH